MIVTGRDGTRWFILKDMGYGFFIEDGDVFAVATSREWVANMMILLYFL